MKLNFSQAVVSTLDGQVVPDIHKVLAQSVYTLTEKLELVDLALKINAGEEVELTQEQLEEIKKIINSEKTGYFAFVKKGLLDFIANAK